MAETAKIKKVGVIGAGNMGASIAEVLAFNGLDVTLKDQDSTLVDRGIAKIKDILASQVRFSANRARKEIDRISSLGVTLTGEQKDIINEKLKAGFTESDAEAVISRIHPTTEYSTLGDADFIIEAAFENMQVKKDIFREVSSLVREDTVIASNTSSLSITSIATAASVPQRVIITHFFNPPYTLPLVEVVRATQTSEETQDSTIAFISGLKNHRQNMVPIAVKERPGFVVNRMLVPMLNEAIFLLEEGVASPKDIDSAMKLGAGMPMGPLELIDMVGLDVTLNVCDVFVKDFGDQKYRPAVLLKRMVEAGLLGNKTGAGFYKH